MNGERGKGYCYPKGFGMWRPKFSEEEVCTLCKEKYHGVCVKGNGNPHFAEDKPEEKMVVLYCANCGCEFEPGNKAQMYCSNKCVLAHDGLALENRPKANPFVTVKCKQCGKEFLRDDSKRGRRRVYCSPACRLKLVQKESA